MCTTLVNILMVLANFLSFIIQFFQKASVVTVATPPVWPMGWGEPGLLEEVWGQGELGWVRMEWCSQVTTTVLWSSSFLRLVPSVVGVGKMGGVLGNRGCRPCLAIFGCFHRCLVGFLCRLLSWTTSLLAHCGIPSQICPAQWWGWIRHMMRWWRWGRWRWGMMMMMKSLSSLWLVSQCDWDLVRGLWGLKWAAQRRCGHVDTSTIPLRLGDQQHKYHIC